MNRLLALLQKENKLTEARLKQVFRQLCKRVHPDSSPGDEKRFIRLRADYEEALLLLRAEPAAAPLPADPAALREKMHSLLHQYAVKEMTRQAEPLLGELVRALDALDPVAAGHWRRYHELFFSTWPVWSNDGDVFYAHGLFIAIVKQFSYFLSTGTARYRTLFRNYRKDLADKAKKLDAERAAVLSGIVDSLERELNGGM